MPDPTFELVANLHLRDDGDDFVDAEDIRDMFARLIPHATIDSQRGRIHVEQRIECLRNLNAPEIVYRGELARLDRTICVDVPIAGSESRLIGFTTGYDGCISLECRPFDVDDLKAGSLAVANALSLDLSLTSQDQLEVGITVVPQPCSADEIVAWKFADLACVAAVVPLQSNWREILRTACDTWLSSHPDSKTAARWQTALGQAGSLFPSLERRIDSLGSIRRVEKVVFDREFWHHCLLFGFDGWTGLINLSGHPGPLLEI